MTYDITTLTRDLDGAEQRFRDSLKALTRSDGAPIYSEDEHAQREAAAWSTLQRDFGGVSEKLQSIAAEARAEVERIDSADITARLSTDELARANALREFAYEEASGMTHDALAERLRRVRAEGSKADRFVWLRAARRVLDAAAKNEPPALPELQNGRPVHRPRPYPAFVPPALIEAMQALEDEFKDASARRRAEERAAAAERAQAELGARQYTLRQYMPRTRSRPVAVRR